MSNDEKITDAELSDLENCASTEEWNKACDRIKDARDGNYPLDWWDRVIRSNLAGQVMAGFAP